MNRTARIGLWIASAVAPLAAQGTATAPQDSTQSAAIKEIAERLARLEASARSVSLDMATRGVYPGGSSFRTEGSIRVLDGTHFHVRTIFHLGDDLTGRSEVVRTPDGVRMLDVDPTFGEVLLEIAGGESPEGDDRAPLLVQLDAASRVLGTDRDVPGVFGNRARTPLGAGLLAELDRSFALEVVGRGERQGVAGRRIEGRLRQGEGGPAVPPLADRVELFVRDLDGALVHMAQFQGNQVLAEVEITRLELDTELDPASFVVDARGLKPRDVREHPPFWNEISKVLAEARGRRRDRLEDWMGDGERAWSEARDAAAAALGWAEWEVNDAFDALRQTCRERREQLQQWLDRGGVRLDAANGDDVVATAAEALEWSTDLTRATVLDLRASALWNWLQREDRELAEIDDAGLEAAAADLGLALTDVRAAAQQLRRGPPR